MKADEIRTFGRVFNGRCINETFRLDPFLMPRTCVNDYFHSEGLGDFCDFAANVAYADNADAFSFNFFCRKVFKLLAGIKIFINYTLMQSCHIQIRRSFQQCFERHVRGGSAVEARCVHQRRDSTGSVSAAPGCAAHVSSSGSNTDSA